MSQGRSGKRDLQQDVEVGGGRIRNASSCDAHFRAFEVSLRGCPAFVTIVGGSCVRSQMRGPLCLICLLEDRSACVSRVTGWLANLNFPFFNLHRLKLVLHTPLYRVSEFD